MAQHVHPNPGGKPEPAVPQGTPQSPPPPAPLQLVASAGNASDRLPESVRQFLPERHLDAIRFGRKE